MLQRQVYEWSKGRPVWQRDLVRRLAAGALDDSQRREVRALLLGEPDAPAPIPVELDDLPADTGDHAAIELVSVGELRNINCLAPGQTLRFAPGLNVVFGNNGAGKSGYGRFLRRVCRAAAPEEVLRDVFDPGASDAQQGATVTVRRRGGAAEALALDLGIAPPRVLSAVGVFDARCADMYLSKPSVIDWSPSSLRLVRRLAGEQDALAANLREEAVGIRERAPEIIVEPAGTSAATAVAALNGDTALTALERLAALGDEEREELARLEAAEASGDAGRTALRAAAVQRARAARAATQLLSAATAALSDTRLATLREARADLTAAEEAEQALARGAFTGLPVTGTGERAWRVLWEAARTFALEGAQHYPPHAGEACPLCQQALDDEAAGRLARFEEFVRGEHRARARDARSRLDGALDALPQEDRLRREVDAQLGQLPVDSVAAAREALESVIERTAQARALAAGIETDVSPAKGTVEPLDAVAQAAEQEVVDLAALDDPDERARLAGRLAELQGRRALGQALPACRQRVAALGQAARLEEAAKRLGTTAVTRLVSQLAEEVITDRLREQVAHELEGLNPVAGRVTVQPKAAKGQPAVQLRFQESCRAAVGDVLSEGEQRALALAFFLAEVAMREDHSAIVLDDPVSSLDHDRRRWVAKRLVLEAQRRQVIVFTHDLAFLHFLGEASERAGIELHGQRVQRYQGRVGVVTDDLPSDAAAPGKRRRELRHRLRTALEPMHRDDDPEYAREVERWLLDLRRGYEYLIEEYVLHGVIRRFSAHVRTKALPKVKPDPALVKRILTGIKDSSEDAHHEPPELHAPPLTPRELGELLDEFSEVCDLANPQGAQRQLHLVEKQAGAA